MKQEIELLKDASNEIKSLRSQNNHMAARLDMFDKCVLLLTANIQGNSQGISPDVVWAIDKFIASQETPQ
jgi:hypothetical protein